MFTGIVEETGSVLEITQDQERDNAMTVACQTVLKGVQIGDSIAINGTCLTVTDFTNDQFTVGLSPETLSRTNLGLLHTDDRVNLERSLTFGGRMGGHYVQGHVDGVGEIVAIIPEGDSKRITIRPPAQLMHYIVEKGYVTVDGVSLTIAGVSNDRFTIALIAYTQDAVIMGQQQVGTKVNLEVDIMAKYVERLLQR
ncbi:MAG: riboflavin synthase [Chloroflexi bacterium AL-W]|nr:riboflavin synthase [Chloroflexi bacterium AL-N1]NOK69256.1 riboflavin synthase [Chloroflexi bacterium AL-N10]NOK76317.1 riboflavin synthase [Chloroflexi bacterium AL-N5]NOK83434.1 riboflavin synthase [Chloroflexi bacterium AL-W]NOK91094.1 riboflavin synthase [Chloroflexi bacterium AL-N15]